MMVLAGIGGLVTICCVGALAIGLLNGKGTTTTNGASTGGQTSTSHGPAKVGSTITTDDVSCTLVSVTPIDGDDLAQPKAGNEFIVVTVKIVNKSSNETDYNPFDFHVKSGSGNITDEEIITPSTYTANNELHAGTLASGGSVTGDIIFQAPKGDHAAELTWQPSFFGSKSDNVWLLGL
jgi:hypothetical protein